MDITISYGYGCKMLHIPANQIQQRIERVAHQSVKSSFILDSKHLSVECKVGLNYKKAINVRYHHINKKKRTKPTWSSPQIQKKHLTKSKTLS